MFGNKKDSGDKKNWYSDRYQWVVVQRNMLAVLTILSLVCSIVATFSISQLAPLKSVDPFVIQVDQRSGITQPVLPDETISSNEAVNQYFIVQYIRARESYIESPSHNHYNAEVVRVLSSTPVYNAYRKDMSMADPASIPNHLGIGGTREVTINSIKNFGNFNKEDLPSGKESRKYLVKAQVKENIPGRLPKVMNKLILISFTYEKMDLTIEERYLNPLGFRVLTYSANDDTLTTQ